MEIKLTTLTPTFIGGAKEKDFIKNVDAILEKNTLYFIDEQILFTKIPPNDLSKAFLNKTSLKELIYANKLQLKDFAYRTEKIPVNDFSDFKRHIFNGLNGKPFLPGSSIKGAIKGAFINKLKPELKKGHTVNKDKLGLDVSFGKIDQDFMRFLQVGDVEFEKTQVLNSKLFNLFQNRGTWEGGWKKDKRQTSFKFEQEGFNTLYECIPNGISSSFKLHFNTDAFDIYDKKNEKIGYNLKNNAKTVFGSTNKEKEIITHIFKLITEYSKNHLKKEIRFIEQYNSSEEIAVFLDELKELEKLEIKANECIIKLGQGTGNHLITGDWQFKDYNLVENPYKHQRKSRKVVYVNDGEYEYLYPMGWVKLTF